MDLLKAAYYRLVCMHVHNVIYTYKSHYNVPIHKAPNANQASTHFDLANNLLLG